MITGGFGMTLDLSRGGMRHWVISRDGLKRWADTNAIVGCDDCRGDGWYLDCAGDRYACPCVMPNAQIKRRPSNKVSELDTAYGPSA